MRTLFVSPLLPPAPDKNVFGYALRANVLLEAAASLGELDMLYYVYPQVGVSQEDVNAWQEYYAELLDRGVSITLCPLEKPWEHMNLRGLSVLLWKCISVGSLDPVFELVYMRSGGKAQQEALERRLKLNPGLLVVQNIPAVVPLLHIRERLPPIVFDLDGIEHLKYKQQITLSADWRVRLLNRLLIPAIKRCEKKATALARRTLLCSEGERETLERLWKLPGLATVPNAVTSRKALPPCSAPTMMFLGIYEYWPNRDAADYLLQEIWPQVQSALPSARLIIAGPLPELIESHDSAPDSVEFTGFVDDLETLYARSRVVTCPLRAGSGTRLKVLEAAAWGRPIVSTSLGAEGIELENETHILLRDDSQSFAQACLDLLRNKDYCRKIGEAAKHQVDAYYDRNVVVDMMKRHLKDASCDAS
jgi:glycosyltransferase involved in cell wall biosynthesis